MILQIFNAEGKTLRTLVNKPQKMGEYSVQWNGKSDNSESLASGSYYYQLRIGDFVSSKKMIILK